METKTEFCEFKERFLSVRHLGLWAILAFYAVLHFGLNLIGSTFGVFLLVLLEALVGLAVFFVYNLKGEVRADQREVRIRFVFFGIGLAERVFSYGWIEQATCETERHFTRLDKYYFTVFTFKLRDGKRYRFGRRLNLNLKNKKIHPKKNVGNEDMLRLFYFVRKKKYPDTEEETVEK